MSKFQKKLINFNNNNNNKDTEILFKNFFFEYLSMKKNQSKVIE